MTTWLHVIDIIGLSEKCLDSSMPIDGNSLSIPGNSIMIVDRRPSHTKRGRVSLSNKEHLPIIRRDYVFILKECLVTEITVRNKRYFFTCLYRSLSQNCKQFQHFCHSLHILMNNIRFQQ